MPTALSFAPASVSNVACGFDCLGFAIDGPGDTVRATPRETPGVTLTISADHGRLPTEPHRNSASVAAIELLKRLGVAATRGLSLHLHKGLAIGTGLGSSAASAVAAVHASAIALDLEIGRDVEHLTLLACALEGERAACGSIHPDNAAPSLLGGFVLARALEPLDVIELPVPDGLHCTVVRPHVEIATRDARLALGDTVPLAAATRQWANLGALVAALHRGDLDLLGRSLEDHVAEPHRADSVPGFARARRAALEAGALGCSLSGSGPALFALTGDRAAAERCADALARAFDELDLASDRWISPVGAPGARSLDVTGTDLEAGGRL
ncbi:MAG: homoserine kinase [Acidobacteriota bacterium]